jgi:tetratricopeptide (TPR) repeat protein
MYKSIGMTAAIVLAHFFATGASPVSARQSSDWRECNGNDIEAKIAACTRILDSGRRESSNNRAIAYNNRGIGISAKGDNDRAIRDFDAAIQLKPNDPIIFHNRGLTYYDKGDYDRAIRDYDEAISLNPKYSAGYNARANVYFAKGEYDKAITGYEDAIRVFPKNAVAYANRGNVYSRKHDFDRAIRDYDEAIRINPKYAVAIHSRSGAYIAKGDYGRAGNDADEAIRLVSDNAEFYGTRGFIYKQQGDYDRAIRDLDEAARLNPKIAAVFSNRGDAWRRKGELDRAIADFGEGIRLDPAMTPAYVNRGLAYEKKGEIDRAKADFGEALSRPPGNYTTTKDALEKARERMAALGDKPAAAMAMASANPRTSPGDFRGAEAVERGPRVALVIGNGAYTSVASLPNPSSDAREMAGALRELGFKVIEGYDLDGTAMRRKIANFGAELPGAGVTLFYYAGHGMQVAGKNYLIPIDAKLERPSSLGVEAIEVSTVLSDMEAEKRVNLVFLDACRDNPLSRSLARAFGTSRSGAVGQGLAQLNAGVGTLITFATSPDTVALDGSGKNSPFTTAMLKHIRTPGLEIRSMLTRVRADVLKATNEHQIPWDHSSLTGDFYFRPGS